MQGAADIDAATAKKDTIQGFVQTSFVIHKESVFDFVAWADKVPIILDAPADPDLNILVQGTKPQAVSPQRLHVFRLVYLHGLFQTLHALLQTHLSLNHRARAQNKQQRQTYR